MTDVFVTADRHLGVVLTHETRRRLIAHCIRAGRLETGGILIGRYSDHHDQAVITEVTGPAVDSVHRRWFFVRGLAGMQRRIDRAWRRHDYYLGEWHFHPFASPEPSDRDRNQARDFSVDPAYSCPEPILLVVGGDPRRKPQVAVGVMVAGSLVPLLPRHLVDPLA
jgi:integrative and conjugative element protein (TIGR02256 family)